MDSTRKSVLVCDTQPVAVEGMKWLIDNSEDLRFAGSVANLELLQAVLENSAPHSLQVDTVIIDKAFGVVEVMALLRGLAAKSQSAPAVVWGTTVTENEALRLLQAGAKGVLRRTSESNTLLTCLRSVISGGTWMEDGIFGAAEKIYNPRRSELTSREREIVALVEKGLRNRDIAEVLGIQTGTVKIHLKHIFEKTGVRGRYGLAFTGLQGKGSIPAAAPPPFTA
ncbi:MAG TPA: response regulator transcription factor [Bryobacteraceae bacterium]